MMPRDDEADRLDPLDLIWEDPHGLAVNKPAGLVTQPRSKDDREPTLDELIRRHLRPDDPESVYLGTVHRLDRPVSGVILWAKTPKVAQRWSAAFADRRVRKEYWAIVGPHQPGVAVTADGPGPLWDDWLAAPDRSGQARVVAAGTPGAVRAITRVEVAARLDHRPDAAGLLWLRLRPDTGRTHQLRAQAAARGWPIVGDLAYGSTLAFGPGIALHARGLTIDHPIRQTALDLDAPLPASWAGWLPPGPDRPAIGARDAGSISRRRRS